MQTRTNIIISCAVGVAILSILALRQGDRGEALGLAEERIPTAESQYIGQLVEQFQRQTTARKQRSQSAPQERNQHLACVSARFSVVENLAPELTLGIFQPGARYPAWVRFSHNADPHADGDADAVSMAIKLLGVAGEKLYAPGPTNQDSHDFLLGSKSTFSYPDVETYAKAFAAFSSNQALQFYLNPFDSHIKLFLDANSSSPLPANLIETRWWSDVAYNYGDDRAVKYSARPCHRSKEPNAVLRGSVNPQEVLKRRLRDGTGCFEFMLQFQTDAVEMSIEDPSVEWDEFLAPFEPVALLTIESQDFDSDEQMEFCENLSYSPWRVLAEHRPLGGINRARRDIYAALLDSKNRGNEQYVTEPKEPEVFAQ